MREAYVVGIGRVLEYDGGATSALVEHVLHPRQSVLREVSLQEIDRTIEVLGSFPGQLPPDAYHL